MNHNTRDIYNYIIIFINHDIILILIHSEQVEIQLLKILICHMIKYKRKK